MTGLGVTIELTRQPSDCSVRSDVIAIDTDTKPDAAHSTKENTPLQKPTVESMNLSADSDDDSTSGPTSPQPTQPMHVTLIEGNEQSNGRHTPFYDVLGDDISSVPHLSSNSDKVDKDTEGAFANVQISSVNNEDSNATREFPFEYSD